jgi:phosphoserine phosphatase
MLRKKRFFDEPGTDVMNFKIFLPKKLAKILALFAQTPASFCKNFITALVFEKNANTFAENWQKSQKIVIITSTPEQAFALWLSKAGNL